MNFYCVLFKAPPYNSKSGFRRQIFRQPGQGTANSSDTRAVPAHRKEKLQAGAHLRHPLRMMQYCFIRLA